MVEGQLRDHGDKFRDVDDAVEIGIEPDRVGQRVVACRQAIGPILLLQGAQ